MKAEFSPAWKSSTQPRKQRKYRYKAPLHVKQKYVAVHLSTDLRKKHSRRSANLRKGDIIKILRGQFKGKTGKVDEVSVKKTRVYVEGIELVKKDGTKVRYPLTPSNLMITELNLDDKKRQNSLSRGKNVKAS